VGIRVTLRPVAWAEWLDRVFAKANYDMSIVAHVERNDMAIYANPDYYFKFNNAQYQGLITQASEARTQAARNTALRKAARILNDQHASDWLWLLPNLQVAKTNVTGFPLNAVGDAYSVADVIKK
jgi:peptide/nickel transport system substrate-binding protein